MDLFLEMRADRLPLMCRGALWTLLSFEGHRLSEPLLEQMLGPSWRRFAREIARSGIGSLREIEPKVWLFRHYLTASDRRRARERKRKAMLVCVPDAPREIIDRSEKIYRQ